ncbi:MAG: Gldg family protein [Gammaproteobacteria bacterium]|nr:Gldg family protein [Gammaproteobacteria bacterium]
MRIECLMEVARKELRLFFASPIGYLFLAAYLGVTLFVFFWGEAFFARNIADVRPMFEWLPVLLIFLASALTMRIWSDERRTGTIEFLSTLPATSWELVVGKFLACMALLGIALILTFPLPISVSVVANLDWGPVVAAYAAALLLGAAYISIGLFVSARSENQIVSLIVSVFVCAVFYMIGSDFVTGLVSNNIGELLREMGSGSRFESISRGILDLSDLYFYVSITAAFLVLNVFALRSLGWAQDASAANHRKIAMICGLVVANLIIANLWISSTTWLRLDVTKGAQYSIASVTKQQLDQLREPLLIRGYFSTKTHPLLAPLVPQIRDLVKEYAIIGGNRVRVEFVDPAADAEKEDEANTKYGIRPQTFQVADRYQTSLVNSYFDILIRYGDEYEVLSWRDLIEVKATTESELSVQLRNPEYDITRAIKKVLAGFQGGGSIFEYVTAEVNFTGYISAAEKLPEQLEELRVPLADALDELEMSSDGKFGWTFVDPEADGGAIAEEIATNFGFQPMAASLFDTNRFYFYLTLSDGQTVVSMGIPDSRDKEGFARILEEGLKRFATGLLTSVALYSPSQPPPQYMGQPSSGSEYSELRGYLTADYDVETTTLRLPIPNYVDVLLVVAPASLSDAQVFEMDQFLMKGGTVVIAAGAYKTMLMSQMLEVMPNHLGLEDWLAHHGVTIDQSMVLDPRNSAFPIPVNREVGGFVFQELRMMDYPFFVDVRNEGFVGSSVAVRDLDQITYTWGSPLSVDTEANENREVVELLRSSDNSWVESSPDVMPKITEGSTSPYFPSGDVESRLLALSLKGKFDSYFEESPALVEARERAEELKEQESIEIPELDSVEESEESQESLEEGETKPTGDSEIDNVPDVGEDLDPLSSDSGQTADESEIQAEDLGSDENDAESPDGESEEEEDTLGVVASVIDRSPESARLFVVGSSEFVSDQSVRMISSARGELYVNSYQFLANLIDVAMEDASLLSIRSRSHFNRTLPPLDETQTSVFEYGNYAAALIGLAIVFGINVLMRRRRRADHSRWFGA